MRRAAHFPRAGLGWIGLMLTCAAANAQTYTTDFSTLAGWTVGSSPGCNSDPAFVWAADATPGTHFAGPYRSAPASLNFNNGLIPGPDFGGTSCGWVTSPPIDLSQVSGDPFVEFWFTYDFNQSSGCSLDSTRLRVSNDGFATLLLNECLVPSGSLSDDWHALRYLLDRSWGTVELRFHFFGGVWVGFGDPTGPFIDDLVVDGACPPATNYCVGAPNTASATGAMIGHLGTTSVLANDFRLYSVGTATNTFGLFFYGSTSTQVPVGNGFVCVGGSVFRLPAVATGPAGTPSWGLDLNNPPDPAGAIVSGSTWYFQCWFRDGPGGWNYSDGLEVPFCD